MAEPNTQDELGRHLANIPLLVQVLSRTAVRSNPPTGTRKVTGIYYNPTTKRLTVVYKAEGL